MCCHIYIYRCVCVCVCILFSTWCVVMFLLVQSIWGQNGLNPPQIATKIKLALCCRRFCEDFRKQKFTKIKRVEHFQIAQFLCEPWGKILKKIGFGTFYQYGQLHVYFKSIWFMFVIKLLKNLYGMCVEQIIHWIRSPKKQILWKTSYIFSDRNTFFFI